MSTPSPSLQKRLILYPLIFQLLVLVTSCMVVMALAIRADAGGRYTDEAITRVIAKAIVHDPDGRLVVRMTPELSTLYRQTPELWFVARDDAGERAVFGRTPRAYASLIDALGPISYAQIRDRQPPFGLSAVIRREAGADGPLTILGHGKPTELDSIVFLASNLVAIPIFLVFAAVAFIVTPWIVRRSLMGVSRIAAEAQQIDVDRRGQRLSEVHVPVEIAPLVRAVNDALSRLDNGYERQRRFISSAAHELRTPIAILRVKLDAAGDATAQRLSGDVDRLANLAEQLLDLQRLETDRVDEPFDLSHLIRRTAGDLAPLLIAAGRTIEVIAPPSAPVRGDPGAIERVIINLVQNAAEHGGLHVIVRAHGSGFEVEDDGPGIAPEERERVFEPFHRLRPRSTGAGLGLNLVQQVIERHAGSVSILAAPGGGTIVRVDLPSR